MIETTASFRILGSFDPEEITNVLGIKPSRVQARAAGSALRNGWILSTPLGRNASVVSHLVWLLEQVEPKRSQIAVLSASGCFAGFSVGVFVDDARGYVVEQPAAILARASALGLQIDIDFYPLRQPDESSD